MRVFRHTVALDGEFLLGSRALRFAVHFDDFGESHTLVSTSEVLLRIGRGARSSAVPGNGLHSVQFDAFERAFSRYVDG